MVDFRINVVVDPKQVPAGTRKVEGQLAKVENRANSLRSTLRSTFGILAGGALVVGAVRSIAQFEESIATAKAVTNATAEEFDALSARAQELGISTRFSATQAADALVNLSRAGFEVAESIEAVDDTLNLAQAGALGLAEAADITASVLRGFRLEVDQSQRVTDVLAGAANRANTTVSELGQGIKFVAPIAAGLGVNLEKTSAAMGVLSDAGLKATLAGTGLRRVLSGLETPTSTLRAVLAEAGVEVDEIQPSVVGLVGALEKLAETGIDTGAALESFGQRGGPAVSILLNEIPKLKFLSEELRRVRGEAGKVARIIDDTLNGALFRVRSAFEGFVLALGEVGASAGLVSVLDGLAGSFRFLAQNATAVISVLQLLAVVITANLLAKIPALTVSVGALIAAFKAKIATVAVVTAQTALLSVQMGGLVTVMAATTAAWVGLKAVLSSFVPVATIAAGGIFLLNRKLAEQEKNLKAAQAAWDNLAEDNQFTKIGAQIRLVRNEQKALNRAIAEQAKRSEEASPAQVARLAELEKAMNALTGEAKEQQKIGAELREARERGNVTVENTIAKLDREAAALRRVGEEARTTTRFEEELDKLLAAGKIVSEGERSQIKVMISRNAALEDQRSILQSIVGPQQQFARDEAALNELLDRGAITAEQFTTKLAELKGEFETFEMGSDKNGLDALRERIGLMEVSLEQGELMAKNIQLQIQLRDEGAKKFEGQEGVIQKLLEKEQQLTQAIAARKAKEREIAGRPAKLVADAEKLIKLEERRIERMAAFINVNATLLEQERLINAARANGLITLEQKNQALADLQLRGLEASNALGDGFARAFAKISREAEDLAAVGEAVVTAFADNATNALVEFAETGEFKFKEFASSLLKDLTRIIARLLIVQALNSVFGGGAGTVQGVANQLPAGRQRGGTVQPGRSFVVGENGPELFVPNRTGTVVPNAKDQAPAQAAPPVIQVVNVQSEEDIPNVINEGGADDAIINAIARNKDRVNQVTQ